jgi:hypothetical protein
MRNADPMPARNLRSTLILIAAPRDGLIRISLTDRDPHRAAEMANGYVEEFKKMTSTLAVTEASQR